MFDFVEIKQKVKSGRMIFYPEFRTYKMNDLMVRGKDFYMFWDEENNLWCDDIDRMCSIIDAAVMKEVNDCPGLAEAELIEYYSSGLKTKLNKFFKDAGDHWHTMDERIIFSDQKTKKTDYASRKLTYPLKECPTPAYNELVSTLYDEDERRKFEWAIGSIIAGESKDIQKFYVFYGGHGTGKSTITNIICQLFDGYWKPLASKSLGNSFNEHATEQLASNPLVAIDTEGDLSQINDNTKLNAIASHESIVVNAKFKSIFSVRLNTTLFICSNSPVKITDQKSGLIRRLIDIFPSGRLVERSRYEQLKSQIQFELSGIAYHCLQVYLKYGKYYYDAYVSPKMLDETNAIYNFMNDMYWVWQDEHYISLGDAYREYSRWCDESGVTKKYLKYRFKNELKEYFKIFRTRAYGTTNVYEELRKEKFNIEEPVDDILNWLTFKEQKSLLDEELKDCKAQYATDEGIPRAKWENVKTKLTDIHTDQLHYVKPPKNHIVIDFDIKNSRGEKDPLLNLEAANKFPATYAELSQGGSGIHLHYIYEGDVDKLSSIYDDDIEVKVFRGNSSLRRRVSKCNDISILTINSGLPLKGDTKMIDSKSVENERHLRALVRKSLRKEIHGHTKPEVDFIKKIIDDAYRNKDLSYDIRDLKPAVVGFAMASTNQAQACFEIVSKLHYCSKDHENSERDTTPGTADWNKAPIVFFDVEVFPNLFIICWKKIGDPNDKVVRMINPTPEEVRKIFGFRLVGFNNRRYDNHIVYARSMGYTNKELYKLSKGIIDHKNNVFFGEAYGLSYTDILDYCSNANKMSLKKWEIKLGIFHLENAHPWDEDVPEEFWDEIADYCCNDVIATEAVWNATQADFRGRQILAELSGLTVNDTSNTHTQQIIFGSDRNPQSQFNYPDLSKEFPGYKFENGVSTYMGEKVGEGGWTFVKPGMYFNGKCEDVSGMHPHSIYAMQLFGREYTERYYDLVRARTYIKHKEYDKVREMFDGRLSKYLGSDEEAKELSNALKTPINSVYGLTFAKFPNRCRDPRNKDNVVAKRGALFMITLKNKVEEMGYEVIHCKTDSIKLANPDNDILEFIEDFGRQYGYEFEIEDIFERICLVNKSTFIAKNAMTGQWQAKAEQFQHPYVFKTLFTHEGIEYKDLCETKNVSKGALYLDMNENLPDTTDVEKEKKKYLTKCAKDKVAPDFEILKEMDTDISEGHDYHFVGRVGQFTPVIRGSGGGLLMVSEDQVKYDAVAGTKGYRWLESETIRNLSIEDKIDTGYFDDLCIEAKEAISKYGDFDIFVNASTEEFADYIKYKDSEYEKEELPF